MKKAILQFLNEKYSDPVTDDLKDMASFVDPRFKVTYFTDRGEHVKTRAAAEIHALLEMQALSGRESPPQTCMATAGHLAALSDRDAIEVEIQLSSDTGG